MEYRIIKFRREGIEMFRIYFQDGESKNRFSMRGIRTEILKKQGFSMKYTLTQLETMYRQACEIGLEYFSEDTISELKRQLDEARKVA